jgi:4-hydroxy-2-oxoheptanedioate aldolase
MDRLHNPFKESLASGRSLVGLWLAFADAYVAEAVATAGFDWLLIDAEHGPNDPRSVLPQLQTLAAYPVHTVVRPVRADTALIKQYLDLGVQSLIVPMVENAAQAAEVVAATRYPPRGVRGVGSAIVRASRWNQIPDYLARSDAEMCVVVQVESVTALANLKEIAAVDGVDGVFFGPADLAASMGLLGRPLDPRVQTAILEGIDTVRAAGKAAGSLMSDRAVAKQYFARGARFVAVGSDTTLLVRAATDLAAEFNGVRTSDPKPSVY